MIEDNIRVLREAARITDGGTRRIEKTWCVIAGNVNLVDEMAYKAIASNHNVKILFREHVILKEGKIDKKFDFIMLYGNAVILDEFTSVAQKRGGAYIKIPRDELARESNLMILISPDDVIKNAVSTIEKSRLSF